MKELLNNLKNKNMTRIIPTFITFIFLTSALSSGRNTSQLQMPVFTMKVDTANLIEVESRDSSNLDKLLQDLRYSDSVKRSMLRKFNLKKKEIQTQQKLIDNVTKK